MNRKSTMFLFAAVLSIAVFPAARALAFEIQPAVSGTEAATPESVAARMVPAHAWLAQAIDANKIQPGQQFKATLSSKIKLADGTELPRGTVLTGIADSGQASGKSTLTLHFTQAQLKDGKSIPIEAMIVHVNPAGDIATADANPWAPQILRISQQNVLSGVDLVSHIGDTASGTLVAEKKDKLKLAKGCALTLAIGTAQHS